MNNEHTYDFSDFELHPDNRPRGQCNRCKEFFPEEELSEPDEVSYYAVCKLCHEILAEEKV